MELCILHNVNDNDDKLFININVTFLNNTIMSYQFNIGFDEDTGDFLLCDCVTFKTKNLFALVDAITENTDCLMMLSDNEDCAFIKYNSDDSKLEFHTSTYKCLAENTFYYFVTEDNRENVVEKFMIIVDTVHNFVEHIGNKIKEKYDLIQLSSDDDNSKNTDESDGSDW